MSRVCRDKKIFRVIDANLNRVKEGLRVCEEVIRFILDDRSLTVGFKAVRHRVDLAAVGCPKRDALLGSRSSKRDVGRTVSSVRGEFKRSGYRDIFLANIQRVKESIRVLEEFSKLNRIDAALKFKALRYDVYELEKKVIKKFGSLCDNR
ncbi:MAG: thiamine-phosphate pyrophosphorylase [Candidatus Omnitrophica bacterium]|nr:thiamine-phosphate pyrophosphorylase [Candidatus Omnitrophota bacterium]